MKPNSPQSTNLVSKLNPKDRNFISALSRGLSVLEAFDPASPRMGITEIAKKTKLSKSTVFRLLHTLHTLGYIIPLTDEKKFTLGPRVLGLGFAVISSLEVREVAQPYLLQLSQRTQETVNLAVLEGWKLVYIERIKTQQILNINLHVGSSLELYNTAMGRVLATFQDKDWINQYLLHLGNIPEAKPYWENEGRKLLMILEEVRKNDYALNNEELIPGLRSVASPVRERRGRVVGAVNLAVSSRAYSLKRLKKELVAPLQETTFVISHALGFVGKNTKEK
jgi:IclR family pca regulon transcriptional regulator